MCVFSARNMSHTVVLTSIENIRHCLTLDRPYNCVRFSFLSFFSSSSRHSVCLLPFSSFSLSLLLSSHTLFYQDVCLCVYVLVETLHIQHEILLFLSLLTNALVCLFGHVIDRNDALYIRIDHQYSRECR